MWRFNYYIIINQLLRSHFESIVLTIHLIIKIKNISIPFRFFKYFVTNERTVLTNLEQSKTMSCTPTALDLYASGQVMASRQMLGRQGRRVPLNYLSS